MVVPEELLLRLLELVDDEVVDLDDPVKHLLVAVPLLIELGSESAELGDLTAVVLTSAAETVIT